MPAFNLPLILTILLSIGAFSAVGAFTLTLVKRDQTSARLKMISERRRELAAVNTAQTKQRKGVRSLRNTRIEALTAKLKLLQSGSLDELRQKMAMAGWRDRSAPAKFAIATVVLPLAFGTLGALWASAALASKPATLSFLVVVGLAAAGGLLPRLLLSNAIRKRKSAITKAFPDALDLMVICVESGLSAEASFNRVTDEMIDVSPELAEETGLLAAELAFLPDRRKPLENLAERTGLASMRSLSTTLLQSEKYGTPVAVGIRVLAQENRDARMAAAEKKAAALPAKLTVPMIVFFLPVLFAVIGGPAVIRMTSGS